MAGLGQFTPALIGRAFFFLAVLAGNVFAANPVITPPELAQVGTPDAAEAERILNQFRQVDIVGDYYLDFELRTLPRRGEEKTYQGKMWGSRNSEGAITRIVLTDGAGREPRLLVQNGVHAAVWRVADKGQGVVQLDPAALFDPVIPGVNLTTFDLQRPFIYWPGATFERLTRKRGRPSHVFLFRPPAAFSLANTSLGAVRAYIDAEYNVPMEIENIDRNGRVTKTLGLVDIKRFSDQWIPVSFEARDEVSRDKTRLVITAAALNLSLPASVFAPASLTEEIKAPDRVRPISP